MYGGWRSYRSVADRKRDAERHATALKKQGRTVAPVRIDGRTIAKSYWGKSWCDNLESYSDYETRMPRGRSYVRNGSVFDLQIAPGRVSALVMGSEVYEVSIKIAPLGQTRWRALVEQCGGQVGSLVELLRGELAHGVMEVLAHPEKGLFPSSTEIELSCSCADWADMCKHVAAALYGVGARLDSEPSLFFTLRQVDERELIAQATAALEMATHAPSMEDLGDIFGIELAPAAAAPTTRAKTPMKVSPKAPRGSAPPSRRRAKR